MFAPDDPRSQWITPEVMAEVRRSVAAAPPLTPEQRDRLRSLLHPAKRRRSDAA